MSAHNMIEIQIIATRFRVGFTIVMEPGPLLRYLIVTVGRLGYPEINV